MLSQPGGRDAARKYLFTYSFLLFDVGARNFVIAGRSSLGLVDVESIVSLVLSVELPLYPMPQDGIVGRVLYIKTRLEKDVA